VLTDERFLQRLTQSDADPRIMQKNSPFPARVIFSGARCSLQRKNRETQIVPRSTNGNEIEFRLFLKRAEAVALDIDPIKVDISNPDLDSETRGTRAESKRRFRF
jgi:hypothetical protein